MTVRPFHVRRRLAASVVAVAVLLGAMSAVPASAAANPYTPTGVCGAGYRVIHSLPAKTDAGATFGRVYLLYKSGGYNCVVTIKTSFVGKKTHTAAILMRHSEDSSQNLQDSGNFKYYASVKGHAPHCISYAGWIADRAEPPHTGVSGFAGSGWGWCD